MNRIADLLADPPYSIGYEFKSPGLIVLMNCFKQANIALIDQCLQTGCLDPEIFWQSPLQNANYEPPVVEQRRYLPHGRQPRSESLPGVIAARVS